MPYTTPLVKTWTVKLKLTHNRNLAILILLLDKLCSHFFLAGLSKIAYNASLTPNNINSGFRATGTWPLNRLKFTDDDFASSYVTDRPKSAAQQVTTSSSVVSH